MSELLIAAPTGSPAAQMTDDGELEMIRKEKGDVCLRGPCLQAGEAGGRGRLAQSSGAKIHSRFRCACIGGETGNERKRKRKREAFLETRRFLPSDPWKRAEDRLPGRLETRKIISSMARGIRSGGFLFRYTFRHLGEEFLTGRTCWRDRRVAWSKCPLFYCLD